MKITVIGSGYVGLVTGACLADKGFTVVCMDKTQQIVDKINAGTPPIHEKGLEELLKRTRAAGRLSATTDLAAAIAGAEVIFLAVGTPFDGKEIDLTYVKAAAAELGSLLHTAGPYPVITVKSTVVPTTAETVVLPILEKESGLKAGTGFGLCSNPEFLREGSAVEDFMNPDRIVIGATDHKTAEKMKLVYAWANATVVETNPRTAEMIKYTANALLPLMISYSNEIANLTNAVGGIDIRDVMKGVHLDYRLNPVVAGKRVNPGILSYLEAGCGFGGSCFPKDVKALAAFAHHKGMGQGILDQITQVNEAQPFKAVSLVTDRLGELNGKKIAVLGLAFKPETDDTRESPSIPFVRELLRRGARVTAHDPIVNTEFNKFPGCETLAHAPSWREAVRGAEAAVIMTRWEQYREISAAELTSLMKRPFLVDTRRMLKKENFVSIEYAGIGYRPADA